MFHLEFKTDNAAFDSNSWVEIARILEEVRYKVIHGKTDGVIADYNGNTIGSWTCGEYDDVE